LDRKVRTPSKRLGRGSQRRGSDRDARLNTWIKADLAQSPSSTLVETCFLTRTPTGTIIELLRRLLIAGQVATDTSIHPEDLTTGGLRVRRRET